MNILWIQTEEQLHACRIKPTSSAHVMLQRAAEQGFIKDDAGWFIPWHRVIRAHVASSQLDNS